MRHLLAVSSLLALAACNGGGCSGCTGSLPANATPIGNAAAVRISRPGLDFLQENLGAIAAKATSATNGVLAIGIPQTAISVPNIVDVGTCPLCLRLSLTGSLCPGGPDAATRRCTATVNLGASTFQLDAVTPSSVTIAAVLPISLDDTAVTLTVAPLPAVTAHVGYGANATCAGTNQDTPSVQTRVLPVTITIPFVADAAAPHATKIDVDSAIIDLSHLTPADVAVCADCGGFTVPVPGGGSSNVCNTVLSTPALKSALVTQLRTGLDTQLKTLLKRTVPALLGTSTHVDLASVVGSFSPTTTGGLDLGLLPFGPVNPAPGLRTGNGITLTMLGGAVASPTSRCVTPVLPTPPAGIPVPDELSPSIVDPAGTPHVGLALSGRFLEYAAANAYNSGLFCLGTTTAEVSLLKVSILSLLVPSLKTLTFEQADAAAAIATRPGAPPTVTLGTSPLVTVSLPRFAVDFYVWSYERYARVFTYTADLAIPLDLTATATGVLPSIGDVKVANGAVSNADLTLFEDPAVVSGAVGAIFGTLVKQLVGGSSSPIDLGAALAPYALSLDVATVRKLTKGDDAFVGVFGNLKTAAATTRAAETMATMSAKRVFADHLQLGTYDRDFLPELEVDLGSDADAVEYAWWIDRGTRSAWAVDRHVRIKEDQLFVQGRHTLQVVARRVGEPASEDPTPVSIPYVIDAVPPVVTLAGSAVHAWDLVSPDLVGRLRVGDAAFGEWQPVASLVVPSGSAQVDVEVRDEEGNIGRASTAASPVPASASGCAAGGGIPGGPGYALFAVGALLLLAVLRRRRPTAAIAVVGLLAATNQGCGCGTDEKNDDPASTKTSCGASCDKACLTDLGRGAPGSYLSVARGADGSVWAAGYNDGLQSGTQLMPFGDLVVGRLDLATRTVDWKTVDGLPARNTTTDGCTLYDPSGWRSGESGPGDDVGRFASVGVTSKNQPIITYYDDTNHRLKVAIDDNGWQIAVLREKAGADVGRASKLLVVDGRPAVVFTQTEPGDGGHLRARIVLASATSESPHGAADFAFTDIAVQEDALPPLDPATYPRALGAYLGFASGPRGVGVVAYDGAHDQLVGLTKSMTDPGNAWLQTVIGAGGVGPSLFIASDGAWHVAYKRADTLRYRVDGVEETVDDGTTPDGLHKVGDDAALRLDDGIPTVCYSDATTLGIRRAVKQNGTWHVSDLASPNRWTAFPQPIPGEDPTTVAAWWRESTRSTRTVTGDVTVFP